MSLCICYVIFDNTHTGTAVDIQREKSGVAAKNLSNGKVLL